MSADNIKEQLNQQMFAESESDRDLWTDDSSASSSSDEEMEVQEDVPEQNDNSTELEWTSEGRTPQIPFMSIPHINAGPAESPYDFFQLLFNATFLSILVSSINTNANKLLLENTFEHGRITQWKDIDVAELQVFLGVFFHMGHINIYKLSSYWRTNLLYGGVPHSQFMSRDRFLLILRNLTFSDPSLVFSPNDPNRFTKPIFNFFNNLMKCLVVPPKNLTIDESIVLWRGRLSIKQYIQVKRHKHGVKLYVLTDSNGITQKMHMYCGSNDIDVRGQGHADKVVKLLMEDYLNVGHSLYIDNFYNSVKLAEDLLAMKTFVTGTLRANRSRNPAITRAKIARGSLLTRYNSRGVCVTNYHDKRSVNMISTEHNSDFIEYTNRHGRTLRRPKVIYEYNKNIKGVHRKDQMLSYYPIYTKSTRWYKKIIVHVMDVMMLNAFMLFNQQHTNRNSRGMSFVDFREEVIIKLLGIRNNRQTTSNRRLKKLVDGGRVHVIKLLPTNDKGKTKRKDCRHCSITSKKRKATIYYCPLCPKSPGLCINCFGAYHCYE